MNLVHRHRPAPGTSAHAAGTGVVCRATPSNRTTPFESCDAGNQVVRREIRIDFGPRASIDEGLSELRSQGGRAIH